MVCLLRSVRVYNEILRKSVRRVLRGKENHPRKSKTLFDRRFLQEGQIGSPSSFLVFDSFVLIAVEGPALVDGV